jgi:DHA2 family multidrug resistance protein
MQTDYGYTATLSGLALMPGGLAMLVIMPVAGRLVGPVQPKYLMAFAMAVVAVAMWHLTSLSPDAAFGFFASARIYQMVALPFLFIPISTASYSGLAPEETGQASALINVARNLGGSIGVSLSNTGLAQRAQFHQERLTEHVTATAPAYHRFLSEASAYLVAQGTAAAHAPQQAIGLLASTVERQASILSYIDVFWAYALGALMMVMVAFAMRRVEPDATGGGG